MAEYTPMITQYLEIKAQHQDAILFFRLGDFYEMFFEDARIASRELEIVLTARDGGSEERIPMCGIPYHACSGYISRLIQRGYKVAICEQVEDPRAAKGIVKREVIKIVTPGTITDDSMLDESNHNYLAAVIEELDVIGLAYIDISTGDFWVTEFAGQQACQELDGEIERLYPAECLVRDTDTLYPWYEEKIRWRGKTSLSAPIEGDITRERAVKVILQHYEITTLESFGLASYTAGIKAAAVILRFLQETQKITLEHIKPLRSYSTGTFVEMDAVTRRNLELTANLREGKRQGSLLGILDFCRTAMGKRLLRKWIEQPLRSVEEIEQRLDSVEELSGNLSTREKLKDILQKVYDLERLAGKLGSGIAGPRDLLAMKGSCRALLEITELMTESRSLLLKQAAAVDALQDLSQIIEEGISDDAPLGVKEGGIIKTGFNQDIDELRELSQHGSDWLLEFESSEKERTGIKYLKVGFNKVFGYYLEVSKSNLHLVPGNYVRRQTLVNTERFICEELKDFEDKILGARERLFSLEYDVFIHIRQQLAEHISRIQASAFQVARLDVLYALSEAAYTYDYIRPLIDESGKIEIKGGRHPVVEHFLQDTRFIPNDIRMNQAGERFLLITGPNMGGKSTYMRQNALLVLMAQMGSFLPAESAHIGIVDKIFTRVGAADNLTLGQSTFMVEMVEVANILNGASPRSLIILDEIGRGTSTYDGLSIARAVSEYIVQKIKARTLFATHYHELTTLTETTPELVNLSVSVMETGDSVVFLKKVLPGKADKSYGIHVARLAGLPLSVVQRSQELLEDLEKVSPVVNSAHINVSQPSLFNEDPGFLDELRALELDELSPREALNILYKWKQSLE